jgi:hypothetical protein
VYAEKNSAPLSLVGGVAESRAHSNDARNAFVNELDFYGIFTFLPILDSRAFLPPLLCA